MSPEHMNECRWCRALFQGVELHLHALHSGRSIEEWQEIFEGVKVAAVGCANCGSKRRECG